MTAIDDAVSTIQGLQNLLVQLTHVLQSKQNGSVNGIAIDATQIDVPIKNLKTQITATLVTLKTQMASI